MQIGSGVAPAILESEPRALEAPEILDGERLDVHGRRDQLYDKALRYTRIMWSFGLLAVFCAAAAAAPVNATPEVYRARRVALEKSLPEGLIVLFGRSERDSDDLRSGFFQEPNFFYLTGWLEPGAVLVLAPLPADTNAPG